MKKKILVLLIILLTVFASPVFAKGDNGFIAGDKVKVKKDINTTSFVAGNTVSTTSYIDGLNFVAGNNITISSTQDHLFVAGNMITVKNASTKDAFVAGNIISIDSSNIRDLYVVGSKITIDSNIERNIYVGGEDIVINSVVNGDVKVSAEKITIGENAIINGKLEYPEDAELDIEEGAQIAKKKKYKTVDVTVEKVSQKEIIKAKISSTIYAYTSLLLVAFILIAVCKKSFTKITKIEKNASEILKRCLLGFGVLVLVPIAVIIVMLTIIGLPLSLLALTLYIIGIYLSMVATAYYCGNWFLKDKVKNEYLQVTIALAIIYVLKLIPIIGGLVGFVSLIFGLGTYLSVIAQNVKAKK